MSDEPTDDDALRLVAAIEAAFPDAPVPPYDRGLDALLPKDGAVCRRTRWRDIVSPRLPHDVVYFFADDAAYRYYLPAWLTAVLRWPSTVSKGNLRQALLSTLTAPRVDDRDYGRFIARMEGLTQAQRYAVRTFLAWCEALDPTDELPGRARRRYWDLP